MRILYVEDNPADVDLVRRALARTAEPPELTIAPDLAAARQALALQAPFDLLLADLNLPDGSGIDLIVEVRAQRQPLAAVALTSQGDESVVLAALRAGADDYLAKNDALPQRIATTIQAALARFRDTAARHARVLRVLYAEHDPVDFDLTRRHFERQATHLLLGQAGDAAELLARLPLHAGDPCDWDVLLLDYLLVGDSGLEVLKVLREDRGLDLPVVMVTGQGSDEVAAHAMRLGATDYVVKRDAYLTALPLVVENAYHRVAMAREQAALERRVAERTLELERANRELEAFAYSVSHDLRAPLRAVDALSAMLQADHASALGPEGQRKLDLLRTSTRRMDQLIRDLLAFARSARETPTLAQVPTAALVRHCLDEFRTEIAERQVEVVIGPLPDCEADPTLLRQVFVNLLANAVKYTRRQEAPRIEVGATLGAGGQTVFHVRDNGAGFDMRHAGKLFTVFQRLHGDAEFEGSGVGLAIVDRIVQRHGGRVWAQAAPGRGATFYFTLSGAPATAEARGSSR